jgi:hypothetical protein
MRREYERRRAVEMGILDNKDYDQLRTEILIRHTR